LAGFDLQPLLTRLTKLRLALLAVHRGASQSGSGPIDIDRFFPLIRTGDGMAPWNLPPVTVLVNPPFTRVTAPVSCTWGAGSVSRAALFVESCLNQSPRPRYIHAILPDVLRTGSRYQKWRSLVSEAAEVSAVTTIGLFDRWTDVDVFTVKFKVSAVGIPRMDNQPVDWGTPPITTDERVDDKFRIRVGSVVAYRHEHTGDSFPYAHTNVLPAWGKISDLPEQIRSRGGALRPPFVLIRRTSRPEDRFRAVGTIITGMRPVAVENHLLVAIPKDRTVRTCRELLTVLRNSETSDWLNKRIRCRHLTVGAVSEIPWRPIMEEPNE
jgi:hypothetical protein